MKSSRFSEKILKRRRAAPMKWTDAKSSEFLELVLEETKHTPEALEKPTAQKFYNRIIERSETFNHVDFMVLKNKMRVLRTQYVQALQWRESKGNSLISEGKAHSVSKYILNVCPCFDLLDQIFGLSINIKPENDSDSVNSSGEVGADFFEICESHEEVAEEYDEPEAKASCSSSLLSKHSKSIALRSEEKDPLTTLQEQKAELEKQQVELAWQPPAWRSEKFERVTILMEIEREKLAWEREKLDKELRSKKELRSMELEHERKIKEMEIAKEIKLMELHLKYKSNK